MASHSVLEVCSGYQIVAKEEDPSAFSSQLPTFDFCGSAYNSMLNWQNELSIQESYLDMCPLMESYCPSDSLYDASLDIEHSPTIVQDDINGLCVWSELGYLIEPQKQMLLLRESTTKESSSTRELKEERKATKCREEKLNNSISKALTREIISKYFYMPITLAARELNVGLTLLKKRCRELGIRRWPHRKLMSLQTLIKNVQEMKKVEGDESDKRLKEAIEILESERKLLEEMPDMQLEHKTKCLRQACFKANYKKRKLMGMMGNSCSSSGSSSHASLEASVAHEMMMMTEDDEEIKSLLNEPFCHANNLMF
ncbi:protein RKD1 [Ricinus communis]|uniref:Transcription factor, putative n=1 Tax=Ricinus communis TaxID=3988 RepID=B9RLY3_RICCO|nr:protein RKD1 [Ricinus communis]EEF47858.1 transcription factor, putative [Ricinus communis]|eukprot:XP_002514752.1 protein RKD1 [Ricinus communis]